MKLRNKLIHVLASTFTFGLVSLSFLTRKSYAMDLRSQPISAQLVPKQVITPTIDKLVAVTVIPLKTADTSEQLPTLQEEVDSRKISAFPEPAQELTGSTPIDAPVSPQQSTVSHASSSGTIQPRRTSSSLQLRGSSLSQRRGSPSLGQSSALPKVFGPRGFGGGQGDPSGSGIRPPRPSQDLYNSETELKASCCGIEIPQLKIYAAAKKEHFTLPVAREKVKLWNEAIRADDKPDCKPQPLAKNLDQQENSQLIFGTSDPQYVFSNKCRNRITNQVEKLSTPSKQRKNRGKAPMSDTLHLYDPKRIIFDDTIEKGHYIEAFAFINKCTTKTIGVDNRDHKLRHAEIGGFEGLVLPEDSPTHLSTGAWQSSTHADLYVRKGNGHEWANIGDISNHTGIARTPTSAKKILRTAHFDTRTLPTPTIE